MMTVRMPDGHVAQIQYFGNVPPNVVLAPVPPGMRMPAFDAPVGFEPTFATMQRISAMMDRQAELMMRRIAAMQQAIMNGAITDLPPGTQAYSASSPLGNGAMCMRSVQITYNGNGAPKVVSHSAGNCGPVQGGETSASANAPVRPAPVPAVQPRTIQVRANGDHTALAMLQPTAPER